MHSTTECSPRAGDRRPWSRTCLGAAALMLAAHAGAATYVVNTRTKTLPPSADNTDKQRLTGIAPVSVSSQSLGSSLSSTAQVDALATASASAGIGGLHLNIYAVGSVLLADPLGYSGFSADALADGSFGDKFMVNAAGLAPGAVISGFAGFAVFGTLSGTVDFSAAPPNPNPYPPLSGTSSASWTASMNVNGNQVFSGQRGCSVSLDSPSYPDYNCGGDAFGVVWAPVQLVNGVTNSISYQGEVRLQITGGGTGIYVQGLGDLSHTIGWAGLSNLRDASGAAVTLTAISPSTGFDYMNPQVTAVPEPGAASALLAGLSGLAMWRRLRSRPKT